MFVVRLGFFAPIFTFRTEQLPDFLADELLRVLQLYSLRKQRSMSSLSLKPFSTPDVKEFLCADIVYSGEKSGKQLYSRSFLGLLPTLPCCR